MKAILMVIAMLSTSMARSQILLVHFDFNRSGLNAAAKRLIDSFLAVEHQKASTGKIGLSGHCDFIGSDSYNDSLSQQRVLTVKKFLETNYALTGRIVNAIGYGENKPLNKNKTEEDRRLNRRVEITILQTDPAQKNEVSLKQKIADTTTKAGTKITLRNINFIGGKHQFLPEAYPVLQELLDAMKMYPRLVIEIRGHICCQQPDDDGYDVETRNYNLSEERAKAVYNYLIKNGVEPKRLSYKGYGHSVPLYPYPEQSEEERIQNRRVEIRIISK